LRRQMHRVGKEGEERGAEKQAVGSGAESHNRGVGHSNNSVGKKGAPKLDLLEEFKKTFKEEGGANHLLHTSVKWGGGMRGVRWIKTQGRMTVRGVPGTKRLRVLLLQQFMNGDSNWREK